MAAGAGSQETRALVRDYMATLTSKERQMRVYEESKVNSAGIQEIYTDMASQYRASQKITRHVNP